MQSDRINVRDFTEIAQKFSYCVHKRTCELCDLREECNERITNMEPSYAWRLADILDVLLPDLQAYTDMSGEEFLKILTGGDSDG